jgi:alkylation response protein AidB-like acyl-CoA dehydrogenase
MHFPFTNPPPMAGEDVDFAPTKEQEMIRTAVRSFSEDILGPGVAERDELEQYPEDLVERMAELNLFGLTCPVEYGGAGSDTISYAISIEELSRVDPSIGVSLAVHNSVATYPILYHGTEEQKRRWLPELSAGERIGAFCLSEAQAGSDAAGVETTAVKDGDEWVVNGSKLWATNGGVAGLYIVIAVTDKQAKKGKGLSAFIVEREREGVSLGVKEHKLGIRSSDTYEIVFDEVRVPEEHFLGAPGKGLAISLGTLDGGRIGIGAQAVGIAQAALEESVAYANEREQFGKPIAKLQPIQWKLADMATDVSASRLLVYQAADLKDKDVPFTREAAIAKLFASEAAIRVVHHGLQIHGGFGYTKDYPIERLYRDARITTIYEGTSEIQRLVIARQIGLG